LVVIALAAIFSPVGPDYYYGKLQARKMSSRTDLAPGYLEGLYKLGRFYSYTMRTDDALRCFDEIGTLFFGFKITEYSMNPGSAMDKLEDAKDRIKKGAFFGPPFKVPDQDLKYVGYALWQVGDLQQKSNKHRSIILRIYKELYMDWLKAEHPQACEKPVTDLLDMYIKRR
jgi:hypothetical protein